MPALAKVKPETKLKTALLIPHSEGINLVLGFNDDITHSITLNNQLNRSDVSVILRDLSVALAT